MRDDKTAATAMRRNGASYNEIYKKMRIPKATLSDWFGHTRWSMVLRDKLARDAIKNSTVHIRELDRVRGKHLLRVYASAKYEAQKEFSQLKYHPLFIAGIMLYWGEGDKTTKHTTRLINTDSKMIRLYVSFLSKVCRIPLHKIRAQAIVYPDLDPEKCIAYWSSESGLSKNNFIKCSVITGRHKTKRVSYGMCIVSISNSYFKVKMSEWLALLPKELMRRNYYASM